MNVFVLKRDGCGPSGTDNKGKGMGIKYNKRAGVVRKSGAMLLGLALAFGGLTGAAVFAEEAAASDAALRETLQRISATLGRDSLPANTPDEEAETAEMPAGESGDSYRLSVRDQIQFSVRGEPQLESIQRIDGDGRIRVPLLRGVTIRGMTVREAENYIERLYVEEEIFLNPEITLRITEYAPKYAHVFGQVNRPGEVAFPLETNSVDIVRVISMAGGFTRIARSDRVSVTRAGEDGEENTFTVDVRDLFDGRGRNESRRDRIRVYPGDVIYVPERLL